MDSFIGCDFGGTKLLLGEIDRQGNILGMKRYETGIRNHREAADRVLECLTDYISEVGFLGTPAAVGAGVVGVVDYENGIWKSMDHIETDPIPLGKLISGKLNIPAYIDNDVKCAAGAEMMFGHGKNSQNFIYLNIGTGIAAGIVSEGRLIRGANNNSGEVGHSVIDITRGNQCICGRKGCVESIASGSGLHAQALCLYDDFETKLSRPSEENRVNAAEVFRLSGEGDPLCRKLTEQLEEQLANLIMNLVRVSDPDTIILGGGLVSDGWLLPRIKDKLNPSTMRGVKNGVVLSSFDPRYAGLIGAGAVGLIGLQNQK